jgi:hypothetical protein
MKFWTKLLLTLSLPALLAASASGAVNVSITAPTNGGIVIGNAPTQLSANATAVGPDTIASVQFYVDGIFAGQTSTPASGSTYTISATITPNPDGTPRSAIIAAVAISSADESAAAAITVTVVASGGSGGGNAPTVVVTTPTQGTQLSVSRSALITANAADSDGNIASVEFLVNDKSLGVDLTYPYSTAWTPTSLGVYTIVAKATDNSGNTTLSDPVEVSVGDPSGNNTPPVITVTEPAGGAILPVNVAQILRAEATDNVTVTSVQFYVNGFAVGAADTAFPFTATWTPLAPGNYTITARATNASGTQGTSEPVVITVAGGTPPTVEITSPSHLSSIPVNTLRNITATAQSAEGTIASVDFFVNGVSFASDTSFPYSVPWTPTSVGTYQLKARATDNVGNVTDSTIALVSVSGGTPPVVAVTSPTFGSVVTVGSSVSIAATATAGAGATITNVQFLANGLLIGPPDTTFPYNTTWTPTAAGTYVLTAVATDTFGNQSTTTPLPITVTGGSPTAPFVFLTSPPSNTNVTAHTPVVLAAQAGDPDGTITSVSFFADNQLIGSATAAPYVAVWTPSTPGTYAITAAATDNGGNTTVSLSSGVLVMSQVGSVPATALAFNDPHVDAPAAGATAPTVDPFKPVKVTYGSKLILAADAVDQDGTIATVQFFANGLPIATATSAPYFTIYQIDTLADVVITAIVTDSSGNSVYTNPILIQTTPSVSASQGEVTLASPLDGASYGVGGQIVFAASHNFGNVNPPKVDFYIDGRQFTTVTQPSGGGASTPYQYIIGLTRPGNYIVHAVVRSGDTTTVSSAARIIVIGNTAPTVSITAPANGSSFVVGNGQTIAASASDPDGTIQSVQFFVNNQLLSTDTTAPYTAAWNPGATGSYTLVAKAIDNSGAQTLSAPVNVSIGNNLPPTVSIVTPASGLQVTGGTTINLTAIASDSDGSVTSVRYLANGNVVGTSATAPYHAAWAPSAAGTYSVIAQATDNSGNITNSAPIAVFVSSNRGPVIALTSPATGGVFRVGTGTTLLATASDPDGTIASVQFFANGVLLGTATSPTGGSYRIQWSPTSEGVYRLSASALDNSGTTTSSSAATVLVVASNGSTDTIATGIIVGPNETGKFAAIRSRGTAATFIGVSTVNGASKTYYFSGVPVGINGAFTGNNAFGQPAISGTFSDTGVFGTLENGLVSFSGAVAFPTSSATVAPGFYSGNLAGRMSSTLAGIVGVDGSIALYLADGGFQTAGFGSVDPTGAFTIVTNSGVRFTGKADPATGFLTGTLTGGPGGTIMAATSSGPSFSDGFLRNLSTRGPVGTGSNILIAGFVVGGDTPKQILVRGIGPALLQYNVTGALVDPQLRLFSGNTLIAQNDNWSTPVGTGTPGEQAIASASGQVGAFAVPSGSRDAALLITLPPGAYSAQLSGVGGTIGIGMIEIYDVDNVTPFSPQKLLNVSSRGVVGTDQGQLIAGFVVNGNTAKKVLIRGVGPTLATVGVPSGFVADPILRLVRSDDNLVVRENDNWESGNDPLLVSDTAAKVGAFALVPGSKDAVILINLPPGAYSAVLGGSGGTTGIGMVEVYEVP